MKSSWLPALVWGGLFVAQLPMLLVYFVRLAREPIYGGLPIGVFLCFVALLALRWNREPTFPRKGWPLALTATGIVAAWAAAISGRDWLAIAGLAGTLGGFLATHKDRRSHSLIPLFALMFPLVRLPMVGNQWLNLKLADRVQESVFGLLNLTAVPYVPVSGGLSLVAQRLYFDQFLFSWYWSWPLFVAVAMLHSAFWQRPLYIAIINTFLAVFWCFAFHTGMVAAMARWAVMPGSSSHMMMGIALGISVYALFVFSERGVRGMLLPIADGASDARLANPLVIAWNWCFDMPARRRRRRSHGNKMWEKHVWVAGVLLTIGLLLVTQATQVLLAFDAHFEKSPHTRLDAGNVKQIAFGDLQQVDVRRSRSLRGFNLGVEVEVWNSYQPNVATQYTFSESGTAGQVRASIRSLGWEDVPSSAPVGDDNVEMVELQRGPWRAQLRMLEFPVGAQEPLVAQRPYLLTAWSVFLGPATKSTREHLTTRFAQFQAAVSDQMNPRQAAVGGGG